MKRCVGHRWALTIATRAASRGGGRVARRWSGNRNPVFSGGRRRADEALHMGSAGKAGAGEPATGGLTAAGAPMCDRKTGSKSPTKCCLASAHLHQFYSIFSEYLSTRAWSRWTFA